MKKTILFSSIALFFIPEINAQITETVTINIQNIDISDSLIKPHMLGVIAGPSPSYGSIAPDLTAKFQDIGVTTIRNNDYGDDRLDMEHMFFCGAYPIDQSTLQYPKWDCDPNNPENYHFTESDAQFQNWINGNFLPFFRLGGEPNSSPRSHDYEGPRSYEETNWIQAGLKVVERYNSFGGDTAALKGYLDIWTEYPQYIFWDRDSVSFNNFWCNSFDSLKTKYPSLKIGGPGFNNFVSIQLGKFDTARIWVDLFLRELMLRNLKPDWIGFHVFSNDIDDFYKAAINYRKLLRAEPPFSSYASIWGSGNNSFFNDVELICDAWGFDNIMWLPSSTRDSLYNKERGAAHHVGVFIALQHTDIERAYIYRGGEGSTPLPAMGLFYGDLNGSYKTTAYGFKLCSQMQKTYNKKLISPVYVLASGGSKIWTLAGEDINGNKAILISNPTANTINLSLSLNNINLSTSIYPFINQYTVSDNNNGQTPGAWNGGVFVLPPYTSHLITMSTSTEVYEYINSSLNKILFYPNPSSGQFTVKSNRNIQSIAIYNVQGAKVYSNQILNSKSVTLNFRLPGGMYFYKVMDNKQFISSGKLTIQ